MSDSEDASSRKSPTKKPKKQVEEEDYDFRSLKTTTTFARFAAARKRFDKMDDSTSLQRTENAPNFNPERTAGPRTEAIFTNGLALPDYKLALENRARETDREAFAAGRTLPGDEVLTALKKMGVLMAAEVPEFSERLLAPDLLTMGVAVEEFIRSSIGPSVKDHIALSRIKRPSPGKLVTDLRFEPRRSVGRGFSTVASDSSGSSSSESDDRDDSGVMEAPEGFEESEEEEEEDRMAVEDPFFPPSMLPIPPEVPKDQQQRLHKPKKKKDQVVEEKDEE